GPRFVYVELPSAGDVAALAPDYAALGHVLGAGGVICFAADGGTWKVRSFAPGLGVAEDPATGSAAGPLSVHLARHGRTRFGEEIEIVQGVEIGRPSRLYAQADGAGERLERVRVGGSAVVIARGEFSLP
ncbi:MAG: PhzF family phenazine biosynthesis protein, partial [Anaeromyxobacteraceae bacterium]